MKKRCEWSKKYPEYHDLEWGVPLHDDRLLFEFLNLEGAQAGLSGLTILAKRENYRIAFDNFNAEKIIKYNENKIEELLENTGIVRNKLKVKSVVSNARAFLKIQREFSSFDSFIWKFVDHKTIQNSWKKLSEIPANTKISDEMSKELKNRGFKFVGSTICYAFMQATGMVNDHTIDCFRYKEVKKLNE